MKYKKHAEEFQRNLARFEQDEAYQEYIADLLTYFAKAL